MNQNFIGTTTQRGKREGLRASHADERREHEDAIRRLQAERKRLGDRINAMYLDKLDGRIDSVFFERMATQFREEQNRCLSDIERHESAEQSYLGEGVQILELAQNAQRLFAQQDPREKRGLLNFLLSNCTWEDGEVVATFRQPFDLLAETTAIATGQQTGKAANSTKSEIWLGYSKSNTSPIIKLLSRLDELVELSQKHCRKASVLRRRWADFRMGSKLHAILQRRLGHQSGKLLTAISRAKYDLGCYLCVTWRDISGRGKKQKPLIPVWDQRLNWLRGQDWNL